MMTGPEMFEKRQLACKALVKDRKHKLGNDFLWRDFYEDEGPNELVNDTFAVVVPHFQALKKAATGCWTL